MNIFVFECNDVTQHECFERNLFGGNSPLFLSAKRGDLCLLFNFYGRDKLIYGVFEATSDAAVKIVPEAWGGDFPKQIRVKLVSQERIAIPRSNLAQFVVDPNSGRVRNKLFGEPAQAVLQYFAGGFTSKVNLGEQLAAHEEDYRLKFPRRYHCTDGHDVRSLAEQSIDDWFSANHGYHEYERLSNIPEKLIPDFTLYSKSKRPVFVEYWGMLDDPVYQNRRLRKCQVYAKYQCALIELYLNDIRNLDFSLRQKLAEYDVPFGNAHSF